MFTRASFHFLKDRSGEKITVDAKYIKDNSSNYIELITYNSNKNE